MNRSVSQSMCISGEFEWRFPSGSVTRLRSFLKATEDLVVSEPSHLYAIKASIE